MATIARGDRSAATRRMRQRIRIGPGSAGLLMTMQEFDALRPSQFVRGNRYELINGVLVVSPAPAIGERSPNDELGALLSAHRKTHPEGSVIDATVPEQTVAATTHRRRADRVIWTGLGRVPDPEADIPSIVVEFVSKRRRDVLRDYEVKRDVYLAAGVLAYWVIDRFRRIMTVYRRDAGGLRSEIVREGQVYRTDLLPGFELPLSSLFAMSDQWNRPKDKPKPARKPTPPARGTDG